jgi:hypothetical protein
MTNDGYTLAETLAALMILGLSIGAVMTGVRAIGRFERGAAEDHAQSSAMARLDRNLAGLLNHRGPFLSNGTGGLIGDRFGFRLPCAPSICSAQFESQSGRPILNIHDGSFALRTRAPEAITFVYETAHRKFDHWPDAAASSDFSRAEPLVGVRLVAGADQRSIAWAPVRKDQQSDCAFDAISRSCREDQP